jgi:beta-lactamase class A
VEKGEIKLNQKVLLKKERLEHYSWSPLKRQNPGQNFYLSVDSLLMYMVAYSDNLACDVLFELVGGTQVADNFIHEKGFSDIHIKYTELEMHEAVNNMYQNSASPSGMTALLQAFYQKKIINKTNTNYLLNYMTNDSTTHKRLLGNLPKEIRVAHKTGTGASNDSLINACNDVGIIYLPNGNHLAIAVFVMDSKEGYDQTEKIIASITKEIFDRFK